MSAARRKRFDAARAQYLALDTAASELDNAMCIKWARTEWASAGMKKKLEALAIGAKACLSGGSALACPMTTPSRRSAKL